MFSHDAWRACDPRHVSDRAWANREQEKDTPPPFDTWRWTVCALGCEIALASDDATARYLQDLTA